jgi:hypothetical protein
MRLEDVRGTRVGDTALLLDGVHWMSAAFHDHAAQAEWHTINSLLRLAGHRTDGVANERIAVVEWWRTVESLVALLHLIALEESHRGLREGQARLHAERRAEFNDKWSAIARWFSHGTDSSPKELTRRVLELRNWRNSFEHSSRQSVIDIKHSRLGTAPAEANLSDAMEAMAICIAACALLRHVVCGLDLMPQVVVPSHHHVFYVPIDLMASDLLFPRYADVVATLGLNSDVQPYPPPRPLRGESLLEPQLAIKAMPDHADLCAPDMLNLWASFEAFSEAQPIIPQPDAFALPDYHRSADAP